MAKILAAEPVVAAMKEDLTARIAALAAAGVVPALAVVRAGERPDDLAYERTIRRRAEALGVRIVPFVLDGRARTEDLLDVVGRINGDEGVHGCLLLHPLPAQVDDVRVCAALSPEKDVDGITGDSLTGVFTGARSRAGFAPATAQACLEMLDGYGIDVEGRRVAVIGRSLVIGRPVAMLLLARDATVTICHSRTADLAAITREADIVICATGRARAFDARYFREGQVVLDVGVSFDDAGAMCGDVDFASVEPVVAALTPVPGGIGSVTTGVTVEHVVRAAELVAGLGA